MKTLTTTAATSLDRRHFLQVSATAAAGLSLAFYLPDKADAADTPRLNAWIDMVEPGAIVLSSTAISTGHEMCSLDPLGIPAKSFSRITSWGGLVFIFSPHVFFALGMAGSCHVKCLIGRPCGEFRPHTMRGFGLVAHDCRCCLALDG